MSERSDQPVECPLEAQRVSAYPRATNYTNVGVVQGIAYLDFGFVGPTVLAVIAKSAKDGQAMPKGLDDTLVPAWRWV